MPIYIAMLRGINVSGQKLIKMERLRALFAGLGFKEVRSYVQSGNVVFKTAKRSSEDVAEKIARKISHDFGFDVPVLIRTAAEMESTIQGNPFLKGAGYDQSKLHVTFLSNSAPSSAEITLAVLVAKSERFQVRGKEIYLSFPDGYGVTKLSNNAIERRLSLQATTRNWKTVNVLCEMAKG